MKRRTVFFVFVAAVVAVAGVTPSIAETGGEHPESHGPTTLFSQESNSTVETAQQAALQAAADAAGAGANVTEAERQAAVSGAMWAVSNGYVNNSERIYQSAYGSSYGALTVEGASESTIANAVAGGVIGGTYYRTNNQSIVVYATAGAVQQATQTATFDEFGRFRTPISNTQFVLAASAGSTAGGILGAQQNESVSLTRVLVGTQTGAFEALNEAIASPNYTATEIFEIAEDESYTFVSGIGDAGDAGTAGPPIIPREEADACPPFCVSQSEPENTTTNNSTPTSSEQPLESEYR